MYFKNTIAPAGVAQGTEQLACELESLVHFPVGTHAWVVRQAPSGGCVRGNHIFMSLSLSLSPSLPL